MYYTIRYSTLAVLFIAVNTFAAKSTNAQLTQKLDIVDYPKVSLVETFSLSPNVNSTPDLNYEPISISPVFSKVTITDLGLMSLGGLVGNVLGTIGGFYASLLLLPDHDRDAFLGELEYLEWKLLGLVSGSIIGTSLGVHLTNRARGKFLFTLLGSAGGFVGGLEQAALIYDVIPLPASLGVTTFLVFHISATITFESAFM